MILIHLILVRFGAANAKRPSALRAIANVIYEGRSAHHIATARIVKIRESISNKRK